jgi:monoamine oxidase
MEFDPRARVEGGAKRRVIVIGAGFAGLMTAWTLTGYSCPAPGDVLRTGPLLAAPFEKRLYFAGEHTCLPFFGYMEGALQSGARAANAILRL